MPTQEQRLQHPIPQNIMSVEFKLFGDLTIKQFVYLALGGGLVFIGLSAKIPFYFRWLLILSGGLGGLGFAFLPLNDRGLDEWIVNFFKAVFSPTQRIWQKEPTVPHFFLSDYAEFLKREVITLAPAKSRRTLREYLSGIKGIPSDLEEKEKTFLDSLDFSLPLPSGVYPTVVITTEPKKEEALTEEDFLVIESKEAAEAKIPLLKKARPFRKLTEIPTEGAEIKLPPKEKGVSLKEEKPLVDASTKAEELRELIEKIRKSQKIKIKPQRAEQVAPPPIPKEEVAPAKPNAPKIIQKVPPTTLVMTAKDEEDEKTKLELERLKKEKELLEGKVGHLEKELKIKKEEPKEPSVDSSLTKKLLEKEEEEKKLGAKNENLEATLQNLAKELEDLKRQRGEEKGAFETQIQQLQGRLGEIGKEKEEAEKEIEENRKQLLSLKKMQETQPQATLAPQPLKPQKTAPSLSGGIPNIINGVVKSPEGKILEGALVIVKDEKGEPVRALKTNALGQFVIATPVPNGKYTVNVTYQKESFDIIEVLATGQELEAIEISGKQ